MWVLHLKLGMHLRLPKLPMGYIEMNLNMCNLIPLFFNLKYMAKQDKIKRVLFYVVNHCKELIILPYWLVQLNIFYSF